MMRVAAMMALSLLMLSARANAQENDIDCNNATSNVEMTHCGWQEFERIDKELNAVYQEAIHGIRQSGEEFADHAEKWEATLQETQRAWIAFRDLNCDELIGIEWEGGSGTSLATATCRTEMTKVRIKELRERYTDR